MHIQRLNISTLRNLDAVQLDSLSRVNVFFGANGSGKTSVLEAIHMLCLGRSFRSRQFRTVIQDGADSSTVFTSFSDPNSGLKMAVGVSRSRSKAPEIRINSEPINSLARLAEMFPLQLLNADSFELIEGGPAVRRQFLDWGVFHVEHPFIGHWQAVKKCIKQRNSLLRHGKIQRSALEAWDNELAEKGELVDKARARYVELYRPHFEATAQRITGLSELSIEYLRGWEGELSLAEALTLSRNKDIQQGYTSQGPHRADLRFKVSGKPAADVLSRGQEKIVVCALRLAQARLLAELDELGGAKAKECIFLIDDLPSELDAQYRANLCKELEALNAQAFITCIEPGEIENLWSDGVQTTMFHVEHGKITRAASQT